MVDRIALLIAFVGLVHTPSHGLHYEREVVLKVAYGTADDQVFMSTPRITSVATTDVGPDYLEVVGDSVIYIGDSGNGKIKRFKAGGGLEFMTEGTADCVGGFAVADDGRIFVRGSFGDRSLTVFDREGKKVFGVSGRGVILADAAPLVESMVVQARAAGLYEPILRDGSGRVYRCERPKGEPFKAWFTTDDGSLEFEISVEVTTLPDSMKGVDTVKYWAVDGRGRLYAVCTSEKPARKVILEWEDREALFSDADLVVLVYDKAGTLLGAVRQDYPPPFMASYYSVAKVSASGNIYCYNYTAEGLEVVRYRPIEE